jgi:hypothetical protein
MFFVNVVEATFVLHSVYAPEERFLTYEIPPFNLSFNFRNFKLHVDVERLPYQKCR